MSVVSLVSVELAFEGLIMAQNYLHLWAQNLLRLILIPLYLFVLKLNSVTILNLHTRFP